MKVETYSLSNIVNIDKLSDIRVAEGTLYG